MHSPERIPTLILVHPGSCCGSADFNLSSADAALQRAFLQEELDSWSGAIVVIDGALSDELPGFPTFDAAISRTLGRASQAGLLSCRILGDDASEFTQVDAAKKLVDEHGLEPTTHAIKLTGAWYDPEDQEGCVNSVYEVFEDAGFSVDVLDSAFSLDSLDNDEDDSHSETIRP